MFSIEQLSAIQGYCRRIRVEWVFLLLFFLSLISGVWRFSTSQIGVSHFHDVTARQWKNSGKIEPVVITMGQFKSLAGEFVVGEPIQIDILFDVVDTAVYARMKESMHTMEMGVFIENSEDCDGANRDVSEGIQALSFDSSFVNEGRLIVSNFSDKEKNIALAGKVVFTSGGGRLKFGDPLKFLAEQYQINLPELPIAPRHVQIQLAASKRTELLTFVTIGMGFLSLFFGLSARRHKKS